MERVLCTRFGDVAGLTVVQGPDPVPEPGTVVLSVEAAGVSFVDALIIRGGYQVLPELPFTPGLAVAGTVTAAADPEGEQRLGDRCAAILMEHGAYASHAVVPVERLIRIPDSVGSDVAATALESYSTVTFAMHRRTHVAAGEWVTVLGAGGGIGSAAIDVAKAAGAKVLAVASTADKRAAALARGADRAIGYDDLKTAIRDATGGGTDLVVDPVGGPAAESALRALRAGGRYCVVGFAGGDIPRLPMNVVLLSNKSVIGIDWGDWARTSPVDAARLGSDVLSDISAGRLNPGTPASFPLAQASVALDAIETRSAIGKLVLRP